MNTEVRVKKSKPMGDVGLSILIGLFILSFTSIYIGVDGWPALLALVPLAFACMLFGYLFGNLGIVTREPTNIDPD